MGGERKLLGRWGESVVARWLRRRGKEILAAGYACRFGEIDLIVRDGDVLAFVEVKLRRDESFGPARLAVDRRKQQRLRTTAELYLAQNPTSLQPRFDVAEVYAPRGMDTPSPRVTWIENAF